MRARSVQGCIFVAEGAPLDDPENHSPARLRGTDQTLRCGRGLGPGLNRLSSGSALARLELSAGAARVRARSVQGWIFVAEGAPLDDPENHSPARLRGTDQTLRCWRAVGPSPLRLSSGSALVRLQLSAEVACFVFLPRPMKVWGFELGLSGSGEGSAPMQYGTIGLRFRWGW